jgi:hypothetical protein
MVCCGLAAMLTIAALSAWRWLRARPRVILALASSLLVAAPVAIAAEFSANRGTARADPWSAAIRSLCGHGAAARLAGFQSPGPSRR